MFLANFKMKAARKPGKVILMVARRLLVIASAILHPGVSFRPAPVQGLTDAGLSCTTARLLSAASRDGVKAGEATARNARLGLDAGPTSRPHNGKGA
jgi:hypothetical protein